MLHPWASLYLLGADAENIRLVLDRTGPKQGGRGCLGEVLEFINLDRKQD